MTILRIYFSTQWRDVESTCPWALVDDNGALLQSGDGPLASMPKANECIGILAANRTLCSTIDVPPGPRRRWLSALPYLAEEHTLPDPEENHVVPGTSHGNNQLALFVTNKSWLKQISDACRDANLAMRKVVPELALPAVAADAWTLVWDGHGGFICTEPTNGMPLDSGDVQSPPLALQLLLEAKQPRPRKIEWRFLRDLPQEYKALPQWPGTPEISQGEDWDWQRAPIPANAPNLLWGELAPPARPLEWWPKLRPAAMLLFAMLGIEMLGTNLQWAMLAYEKRSLNREMEQSFHQAFGNAATVVNAPLQMQRNLADLRHNTGLQDDGDFLSLLNSASRALANLPAGSLREMHYESGRVDIEISLDSPSAVTALQNKFHDMGISARTDTQDTGNGVKVKITLQQGAAI